MSITAEHMASRQVLVVDDSTVQREHMVELCRQIGVKEIFQCDGGQEALLHAMETPEAPDVLIVDLEMPDMDGIALLQALVQRNRLAETGVIVASGRESTLLNAVEPLCKAMGIRLLAVLKKPVSATDLLSSFARHDEPAPAARPASLPRYSLRDLEHALSAHEFVPWFQPKVTLHSAELAGVETLIRWCHPAHGIVAPGQFIAQLEQSELIAPVTLDLLNLTLAQAHRWRSLGLKVPVSINLSARLLSDMAFIAEVIRMVRIHEADPQGLIFEVTETAIMSDLGAALGNLARLRLKGFGLSIDDFGTGFASMRQLSQAPFTELKIDRSLVHESHRRPQLHVVLKAVIGLAEKLQLKVVAEGIETLDDWLVLRNLQCGLAQGFLIARPMPGVDVLAWAAGNHDPLASANSRVATLPCTNVASSQP
jgi:EAL domain-containing protein (putative c-di-GMP-specific phosphodiesterase class I)